MQIVGDAHRDHIARHEVAAAKARIIAIGDNICQAELDGRLNNDVSGYCSKNRAKTDLSTKRATGGGMVRRRWPVGRSRNALINSIAASKPSSSGRS